MREINAEEIANAVAALCIDANVHINHDIKAALSDAWQKEDEGLSRQVLSKLIENAELAAERGIPICQDTGMAVVFVKLGCDVHVVGGHLPDAIQRGVRQGYEKGCLRKSVVRDPIDRINTNDNTPAVIHYDIVEGDKIKLIVAPKGFGSENMSVVKMLTPSDGIDGVKRVVVDAVRVADSNPCPPIIVGVGVGGTMEKAALIAKQALLRDLCDKNENEFWAEVERDLLNEINGLGIGAAGFGGRATALGVKINVFPTHIAGLPVAVNIGCHVTRHKEAEV